MVVTLDGIHGALDAPSAEAGAELGLQLALAGYSVRVNALRVAVHYGPGYDSLVWAEGDFEGHPVGQPLT